MLIGKHKESHVGRLIGRYTRIVVEANSEM